MKKIMRDIRSFVYRTKRGGLKYSIIKAISFLGKAHIITEIDNDIEKRFFDYFDNMHSEMYERELKIQLKTIIDTHGEVYNIDNPKTFNEKIQWLKVHDLNHQKTLLADKYAVRRWVCDIIGEKYLIPLVGGPWKCGEEILFEKLPAKYVLKANHGSGMNYVVQNNEEIDKETIIKMVNKWMGTTFGWLGMETQYFNIERRIIAEEYIEQIDGNLLDYKIHCFEGEPRFIQIIGNRKNLKTHVGVTAFYDLSWNKLEINTGNYPIYENDICRPFNLEEMIEIARKLSKEFKYVRVDLYNINNQIKFGEMTFTPGGGVMPWTPPEINDKLGDLIHI